MPLQDESSARRLLRAAKATAAIAQSAAAVEGFVTMVRSTVRLQRDGPVLRYSVRDALVHEGERRGLARFEANLIIAGVMHRMECTRPNRDRKHPSVKKTIVGICAVAQCAICLTAWLLFV